MGSLNSKLWVHKNIYKRFFLNIVSAYWFPLVFFIITIIIIIFTWKDLSNSLIKFFLLCVSQKSLLFTILFGIATLIALIITIFVYQEVRTDIGGLSDLLEEATRIINESHGELIILAMASNIGQAYRKKDFERFKKAIETKLEHPEFRFTLIVPPKQVMIDTIIEPVITRIFQKERDQRQYRVAASSLFAELKCKIDTDTIFKNEFVIPKLGTKKGVPYVTAIITDEKEAVIVFNEEKNGIWGSHAGFSTKKPHEVKLIIKVVEFIKDMSKLTIPAEFPKAKDDGSGWLDC